MDSRTGVAAIVVTYNRRDMLTGTVDALLSQTVSPDAIIVVDNASTDGTADLFTPGSSLDHPQVRYIRLEENLGGAGGFKRGISVAHQDGFAWCWVMDDDVVPDDDALEQLIASNDHLEGHGVRPSFLASHVTNPDGELLNVPVVSSHLSANGYPDWSEFLPRSLVRIEIATFVSLLIPMWAVGEVGLPIANFFMWGDDSEYTKRLTSFVGPAFLCGTSHVTHLRSISAPVSTVFETDEGRVRNHRRATRNDFISTAYYGGTLPSLRLLARHARDVARIAVRRDPLAVPKIKSICTGVLDFALGRFDLEDLAKLNRNERKNY
jgi:dTDP-4-dehydrorhamnose reductase